eukprot:5153428-Alexandrium_andersonii.AAC.1
MENFIFTTGVPEIAYALGVTVGEAMQIAKACYGLTTAPRSFWLDFKAKVEKHGGHSTLGDPCTWIWVAERPCGRVDTIGFAGTHVDDVQ